ncbi:MAG: hypothetical protein QGF57_00645 [Candidatus Marinimicrobia bacterium]|nr:hypothetical protein [Candidatus Neomarinimicrobiota bacterium]
MPTVSSHGFKAAVKSVSASNVGGGSNDITAKAHEISDARLSFLGA